MANNVKQVMAGKPLATGGALVAPIGTALPTDETTALNAAFLPVGYLGDSGVEMTPNRSTDTKKAWGGDTVLVLQTEFGVEVKLTLIESLNVNAAKAAFGAANVTSTANTSSSGTKLAVKINAIELDHNEWVIELKNGVKRARVVLPDAQVTKVDTIPFKDDDSVAYPCTITCFPDASGNYGYVYTNDGVTTLG